MNVDHILWTDEIAPGVSAKSELTYMPKPFSSYKQATEGMEEGWLKISAS